VILAGIFFSNGIGQESTYLAQKLMLENDLRNRIESALEKILDDHRYVLDLTVELRFTPTVREEVTFKPAPRPGQVTEQPSETEEARPTPVEEPRERTSRVTGIPIPGFDFQMEAQPEETVEPPPVTEVDLPPLEEAPPEPSPQEGTQVVSQSYTDITASVPTIERMEISCILPEGSPPELVENVRQIIQVASHFSPTRGDVLSIMTASFRERRDERTAEAIILRSIAEKIDQLEEKQAESDAQVAEDWRTELETWKEEEGRRREEEQAIWRAELEKLENERLRRDFENQRQALLERDSVRVIQLTAEIDQLREALASATLSTEEEQAAVDEVTAMEQEKAQLDSVIEEKLAMLQQAQEEMKQLNGGMENLPIYLMSAISLLAVIAMAAVILFNGKRKQPRYVMPPPWMMGPPRKKKVTKPKNDGTGKEEVKAEPTPPPPGPPAQPIPPAQPPEDPAVMQSEIKSTRQSIVSAAVGSPETATDIVKEWLEEEAPVPVEPVAAAPAEAAPSAEAEEEEEKKGKKKKKKK